MTGTTYDSATTTNSGTTYFSGSIPKVYANATSSQQVVNYVQFNTATSALAFTTSVSTNSWASTTISVASGQVVAAVCPLKLTGDGSSYTATIHSEASAGDSIALNYPTGTVGGGSLVHLFTGLSAASHTFRIGVTGGTWAADCLFQVYKSN